MVVMQHTEDVSKSAVFMAGMPAAGVAHSLWPTTSTGTAHLTDTVMSQKALVESLKQSVEEEGDGKTTTQMEISVTVVVRNSEAASHKLAGKLFYIREGSDDLTF